MRQLLKKTYQHVTHAIGRVTKNYFFEDFKRVYPDGLAFNRLGIKVQATTHTLNNYANHRKFYIFASQFVRDRRVSDIGCGSGYGCQLLMDAGPSFVSGSDVSRSAIRYARKHFHAEFLNQEVTKLEHYPDNAFDVSISSEVLEHVLEYGMEQSAIAEMKRITKPGGLIIIGTPNTEMCDDHGFSFDEISQLISSNFARHLIFENALVPFAQNKALWKDRLQSGRTGTIVSERIDLDETVLPNGIVPETKIGIEPQTDLEFFGYSVNTKLLHNTHSWAILAIKD